MPYYPEDQSNENLKKLRHNNVCTECGRELYIFFDLKTKQKYIACPTPGHKGISREYQPQREDNETDIRRSVELEEKIGHEATRTLATIPKHGQLTQPQAEYILSLVYPGVPRDEIIRCAILCRDFGLHPLMKEVYIIGFLNHKTGKTDYATVIGIEANRKMAADKKGAYSFIDDSPRAATQQEIVKQYGKDSEEERDNLISICKVKGEKGNESIGFGLWPKDKVPYGMDKGNTKRNMANIRSERQATSRLPGGALPQVEVIDEAYAEVPDVGKVALTTGEIIEGELIKSEEPETKSKEHWCEEHNCPFEKKTRGSSTWYAHKLPDGSWCNEGKKKEVQPEPSPIATGQTLGSDIGIEPEEPQQPKRDPDTIKTINELFKACHEDFVVPDGTGGSRPMQPADVTSELGVSSQSDISDTPAECYRKIAAVR